MNKILLYTLALVMVFPLLRPGVVTAQGGEVYEEDFVSYDYKAYTDNTVAWNVFDGRLSLAPMSGRNQSYPAVAPDNHGGAYVVWMEIREADMGMDIYAQRVDEDGNRLWPDDVRVHQSSDSAQMFPAVAVDTTGNAIVVWRDDREGLATGHGAVYVQKISPNGTRLWTSAMRVNSAPSYPEEWLQRAISVAMDNDDNAIIVWQGNRDDKGDLEIYAQKIDSDGNRLWTSDVQVSNDEGTNTAQRTPDVAVNSQGVAIIVWVDGRHGGQDIYAQALDGSGNRLWSLDTRVSDEEGMANQGDLALAIDISGNAVVVWRCGARRSMAGTVYAQKVSPGGQRLWDSNVQVNQNPEQAGRGWPGVGITPSGDIAVVWANYMTDYSLYMQRLSTDGTPQWTSDVHLIGLWMPRYLGLFRLDAEGRGYLVWHEWWHSASNDVYLQRLDLETGAALWDGYAVRVEEGDGSAAQIDPDVEASAGGEATVIWGDFGQGDWTVYGSRIDEHGDPVWPTSLLINVDPITSGRHPRIAGDTAGTVLAVWSELSNIRVQRVDQDGNRLWPTDLIVNDEPGWDEHPAAVLTPDGSYYVVWLQQRSGTGDLWDLYAQRLNEKGQLLWPSAHQVNIQDYAIPGNWTALPYKPSAAVDTDGCLVVAWYGNGAVGTDIYVQRISPNGDRVWDQDLAMTAHLPPLGETESDLWGSENATTVVAGAELFVFWMDNRNGDLDIYAHKLDRQGNLLWGDARRVNTDTSAKNQRSPAATMDDEGNPIVVWVDCRDGPQNVYAQRLDADGAILWASDVRVNTMTNVWPNTPSISQQPLDFFVVAWQTEAIHGNMDVCVQRLGRDGNVQWPADRCITESEFIYYPDGIARSTTVDTTPDDILQATLSADTELNGGSIEYYLSNDGGQTWDQVQPGVAHLFTTTGSDLRWKVDLAVNPVQRNLTPIIESLSIGYSTVSFEGDAYEPDDTCDLANPIVANGAAQPHAFHQYADADWVWFEAISGTTYIIQTAHTGPEADTVLGLYDACGGTLLDSDDDAFSTGSSIIWEAPAAGVYYVRVNNHNLAVYGPDAYYHLAIRTYAPNPVAIIAAGHDDDYNLQANINHAARQAYETFLNGGFSADNIYYLHPDPAQDEDADAVTTVANVQTAIQTWAQDRVGLGVPLFIYLIDHGNEDRVYADGNHDRITASDLNLWLSNLEAATGCDLITVIVEACHSGSFIDVTQYGPAEITGPNRVVVASTGSQLSAFPSPHGATFSDAFFTALGDNQDVWTAFQWGVDAVDATGLLQTPWLDDNGDALHDTTDGDLARNRGLAHFGSGSIPVIDEVQVGEIDEGGSATIQAQVRDNVAVIDVTAVIFPPSYEAPPPGEPPPGLNVPTLTLTLSDTNVYAGTTAVFTEAGVYRVVVYALDNEGNAAMPKWVWTGGQRVFLPSVMKDK